MEPSAEKNNAAIDKELADRLTFAIKAANIGFWEVDPATNVVKWDGRCQELFGLTKDHYIPYSDAVEHIHPDDVAAVNAAVERSLNGENEGLYDMRYRTIGADDGILRWVRFTGRSYFDERNRPVRFGGIAQDITKSQLLLQESEARFRNIVEQSPVAIGILRGRDMVVELGNDAIFQVWGKTRAIIGKKLIEALPEIRGQRIMPLLYQVYDTGDPYYGNGRLLLLERNGKLESAYFNFVYTPLRTNGVISGVMVLATEVTELVIARKTVEENEAFLKAAVEIAELATWSIDAVSGRLTYSRRLGEWLGSDTVDGPLKNVFQYIDPADRENVANAIQKAMTIGSDGIFDVELTVNNPHTAYRKVLHSQGKTLFDDRGRPLKLVGTAQDITVQRQLRFTLEEQIQLRIAELDALNEELRAANQGLARTNDELTHSNESLLISNQDLQQFAHVTSHDLKEPLRKIKFFLSRMTGDAENIYSEKSAGYVSKIETSVERMQNMIDGILSYSRTNGSVQLVEATDLNALLYAVLADLEIVIADKGATICSDPLPVVAGSPILLNQLIYNLLINALKFSDDARPAMINIHAGNMLQKGKLFHRIEFIDNGIGFDQQYAERIFTTFTRLNSKDKYEGTGLGLALCRKIIQRHHGSIEAFGERGKGARFVVYLPAHDSKSLI